MQVKDGSCMWMDSTQRCGRLLAMAVVQVILSVIEFVLAMVLTFVGKKVTDDLIRYSKLQYGFISTNF
jgi:hypothetical protein